MNSLVILGSTGSIGTQSIECALHLGFEVEAISANGNISLLEQQIRRLKPKYCAVSDIASAHKLKQNVADTSTKIFEGAQGILEMLTVCSSKTVINAIIGFAGLCPTLKALDCKKKVAIANKETLVAAGEIVMRKARLVMDNCRKSGDTEGGVIIPIDSEHCAIHQCIGSCSSHSEVKRLIITASGGPFFGYTAKQLENVSPAMALKHPNWSMGSKITIDSATMVNKGLEIIEASHLFDLPVDSIDYIVHRQSIVHSMVEFTDCSVLAQLSVPDMRMCIQYALTYPKRLKGLSDRLDLSKVFTLSFENGNDELFPAVTLARKAARLGGIYPCVFNSANEACVDLFLKEKIKFTDIYTLISAALDGISANKKTPETDDIINADKTAREFVYELANNSL